MFLTHVRCWQLWSMAVNVLRVISATSTHFRCVQDMPTVWGTLLFVVRKHYVLCLQHFAIKFKFANQVRFCCTWYLVVIVLYIPKATSITREHELSHTTHGHLQFLDLHVGTHFRHLWSHRRWNPLIFVNSWRHGAAVITMLQDSHGDKNCSLTLTFIYMHSICTASLQ